VIKEELLEIRRSTRTSGDGAQGDEDELDEEDLIAEEDVVITGEPCRLREAAADRTSAARVVAARGSAART
jgi:hypothetical protein